MIYILIVIFVVLILSAFLLGMGLRIRREDLGGSVRIAQITDLHKRKFGKNNCRLIHAVCTENPDIIAITGDLVSRDCTDFEIVKITLDELCKIAPVYIIFGNHESDLPAEYKKEFIQIVENSNAVFLRNQTVQAQIHGKNFNIAGLELPYETYKKDGGYKNLDSITSEDIRRILGNKPGGETVLLVHNPKFAREYAKWGADFAICGHIHGGIIRNPLTGQGLLSPERKLFPEYTRGIYTVSNMKLLLSSGLGKVRMFNPPEIVIYKI